MRREEIRFVCERVAPHFRYDPLLIAAICDYETEGNFGLVRMPEQRVDVTLGVPPVARLLLTARYGLMLVPGRGLEVLGAFPVVDETTVALGIDALMRDPEEQVRYGCAWLCVQEQLVRGKAKGEAHGIARQALAHSRSGAEAPDTYTIPPPDGNGVTNIVPAMLSRYGSDESGAYAALILARYDSLRKEYKRA